MCYYYLKVFNILHYDISILLILRLKIVYCDCITAILLHNLLSLKYHYNKESRTVISLLFTKNYGN